MKKNNLSSLRTNYEEEKIVHYKNVLYTMCLGRAY